MTKDFPKNDSLKSTKGCWLQPLDYEGIPFKCRRCFQTGHIIAHYAKCISDEMATWWKEVSPHHYLGEKGESLLKETKKKKGCVGFIQQTPKISSDIVKENNGFVECSIMMEKPSRLESTCWMEMDNRIPTQEGSIDI